MKQYRLCYLAGPWFTPEQADILSQVENELELQKYRVYSPRKEKNLETGNEYDEKFRKEIVRCNINAIASMDFVVAITDYKDMGTLFEAGVAYQMGRPIVYVSLTLGDKPFNLMLTETGIAIAKSRAELSEILKIIFNEGVESEKLKEYGFKGRIE